MLCGLYMFLPVLLKGQGMIDGYMKGKGKADFALSYTLENSTKYYAGTTEINVSRKINSISLFGVYGITNRLDVLASIPYINGDLQDGNLYLKYSLADLKVKGVGDLKFIVAGGISTPLSNYFTESAESIGQQATTLSPRGLIQLNLKHGFFINVISGYNHSSDPTPASIPASVKLGMAKGKWYGDVWLDYQSRIGGKDYRGVGDRAPSTFRELGVSYAKVGGVIYYGFKSNMGVALGGAYTLGGENTSIATRVSVGYIYKIP